MYLERPQLPCNSYMTYLKLTHMLIFEMEKCYISNKPGVHDEIR